MASALPAKPVFIRQPAPRYSGSVIDLWSAPDGALASASTSLAKLVFGQSSGVVKENRVLVDQNHALAIVVGQMKSREIEAAHKCRGGISGSAFFGFQSALFGLLESTR